MNSGYEALIETVHDVHNDLRIYAKRFDRQTIREDVPLRLDPDNIPNVARGFYRYRRLVLSRYAVPSKEQLAELGVTSPLEEQTRLTDVERGLLAIFLSPAHGEDRLRHFLYSLRLPKYRPEDAEALDLYGRVSFLRSNRDITYEVGGFVTSRLRSIPWHQLLTEPTAVSVCEPDPDAGYMVAIYESYRSPIVARAAWYDAIKTKAA